MGFYKANLRKDLISKIKMAVSNITKEEIIRLYESIPNRISAILNQKLEILNIE